MIELSPGAVIGQYKLVKNLREPLQSHSWLATAADGQSVVIKLFERGAPSKDAFNKLLRLKHPALELSWSRFEDDKWTGYVRPWYENLTHPGTERFTLDRLLALGMRFAEALQVSHDGGLAHNGLQPSNLFTRDNSQLLITDPCTVTKNADGQDHGVDGLALDLQACGHCLESWTNRLDTAHPRSNDESSIVLPPRLTWLITALKVPEKSLLEEGFHRVRDELDDIRLQWQRALRDGIPANWREGRADYRPDSSLQRLDSRTCLRSHVQTPLVRDKEIA